MFCENCGNQVQEADEYCNKCGCLLNDVEYKKDNNVESPILISKILLSISCFVLFIGLVPINIIYEIVMLVLTIPLLILSIIFYFKRKDKMLLITIILNSAGIYTLLGWIYYIFVAV